MRRAPLAIVAACAIVLLFFSAGLWSHDDSPESKTAGAGAGAKSTWTSVIACARLIVEGDVTSIKPISGDRVVLSFAVADWLWPTTGGDTDLVLNVRDPTAQGVYEPWKVGEHLLIIVAKDQSQLVEDFRGSEIGEVRSQLGPHLADAAKTSCTAGGHGDND